MSSRSSSELSSDRGSPVTRPGSSATGTSIQSSMMGQQCTVDGCTKLCFTGVQLCQVHAGHKRGSTPLMNASQLRSATSSSGPAGTNHIQTRMGTSNKHPSQIKSQAAQDTFISPTERRPEANIASPQSLNYNSPKKMLDAKFVGRKSTGKPKSTQSNSAAATEAEIVVASSPEPAVRNEQIHQDEESTGPPRKKVRTSPASTQPSIHPSGPVKSEKDQLSATVPKSLPQESSRVDDRRRIGENKNFDLRAQTENPSPPAHRSVGRGNIHSNNSRAKDFPQPAAASNATLRTRAPENREVSKTQSRSDVEGLNAPRQAQRILPAPVPTLGKPSPPSVLASSKSPNPPPPPGADTARGNADQTMSRATYNAPIIAPQPQSRTENHVLNRETSLGQGQQQHQKTAAQSNSPLLDNLFLRQESHLQPPRSANSSPRPSPLPSEQTKFNGFGLRNTGLGRSESPNPGPLRQQQDTKSRSQPVSSAQASNAQGGWKPQSNGLQHPARVSEPTPSLNAQNAADNFSFNLKQPGRGFLEFSDASRGGHHNQHAVTPQQVQAAQAAQTAAQTAAQRALNYSAAFATHNGQTLKKPSSPSRQLPPAAVAPTSSAPRAPIAPMMIKEECGQGIGWLQGLKQNGHKRSSNPPVVINLDTSSDEEEEPAKQARSVRPVPQQPSATDQIRKIQQARQAQKARQIGQGKQTVPNGTAAPVAPEVVTKLATSGAKSAAVSGTKPLDSDRPSVDRQKPASTVPEAVMNVPGYAIAELNKPLINRQNLSQVPEATMNGFASNSPSSLSRQPTDHSKPAPAPAPASKIVANGSDGKTSGANRPLMPLRKVDAAPNLTENLSGGKSSDSDRPLMERWKARTDPKATIKPSDERIVDPNRLPSGPARGPVIAGAQAQAQTQVKALNTSGTTNTDGGDGDGGLGINRSDPSAVRNSTVADNKTQTLTQTLAQSKGKAAAISAPNAEAASSDVKTSDSDRPLLAPDKRWKNLTAQKWQQLTPVQRRKVLVDTHDANEFDSAIYSKANETSWPQSVVYGIPSHALQPSAPPRPVPKISPHINPWTHWTHARTPEWHAQKQEEIKARGNRKDSRNFGQAAKRLAQGKAARSHLPSKFKQPELPDRVKTNPAWMSALAELDKMKETYHADQRAKRAKKRNKGKGKAAQQLVDKDGDVEMDSSPESAGDESAAHVIPQNPTEFVLHRGDWTIVE
ncbi:hypothetical protein PG990_010973 [Apiospora arundinis]